MTSTAVYIPCYILFIDHLSLTVFIMSNNAGNSTVLIDIQLFSEYLYAVVTCY